MSAGWIDDRRVEAITGLLEQLQDEGWSIGTSQIIATHSLLVGMHERADGPPPLESLATWLGPIACRSQQQQRDFPQRLSAVLEAVDALPPRKRRDAVQREARLGAAAVVLMTMGVLALFVVLWLLSVARPGDVKTIEAWQNQALPDDDSAWSIVRYTTAAGATGGVLLVASSLWVWSRRKAEARLRKIVASEATMEQFFASVRGGALTALDFRQAAQTMRRRHYEESEEVDVEATVRAATVRGGWLAPVYKRRGRSPEYAVLIDQTTTRDVQAKVFELAAEQLAAYGVAVDVFFFDRDPRICWRPGMAKERFRFETIASAYSGHHLMMFTDGEGLVHPRTGRPARWLEGFFGAFSDVAVLTPRPALQWDAHETYLARGGAVVLPASTEGIAAYVGRNEPGRRREVPYGTSMMPLLLDHDAATWVSTVEPPRALIRQLLDDLPVAIGPDAMRWLAAAAVYPGVEWSVLLHLGRELRVPDFEENLLALARLPWFRRGQMPDWLRIRLLEHLDPETERDVRAVLFRMFDEAVFRKSGATVRLARYRDLANAVPEGSDLAEHVVVDFMSGRKPMPLYLSLPQRFLRRMERWRTSARPVSIHVGPLTFGGQPAAAKSEPAAPRVHGDRTFGTLQRMGRVLLTPAEAFTDIARRPDVLKPVALLVLLGYLSLVFVAPRMDFAASTRARNPNLTEEQIRISAAAGKVFVWFGPLTQPFFLAGLAALLLLGMRLAGGRGKYKQAVSITAYAWTPLLLSSLLLTFFVVVRGTFDPAETATIIKSNPAFLADQRSQPMLFSLLSSFDVFTFWTLFLLIHGCAAFASTSKRRAGVVVTVLWLLSVIAKMFFAGASATTS